MASSSSSGVSGFTSTFDWRSFVSQMVAVERAPQQRVRAEQTTLNKKRDAIGSLVTALSNLQERAKALSNANLFNSRTVSVSNSVPGLASASATDKALTGNFTIEVVDSGTPPNSVPLFNGPWKGASITGLISDPLTQQSTGLTLASDPSKAATLSTKLSDLSTAPTAATGSLVINGKTISLNSSNTLADVITGINGAGAGVSARFDTSAGAITITSTTSSDPTSIILDTTTDYASALLPSGSVVMPGIPLRYKLDGGTTQFSKSPILTDNQTGLVGLTVTVSPGKIGTIDLTSSQDVSKMKGAITEFIDAYNKVQSFIGTQAAVTTNADGTITSGVLAFDGAVAEASAKLRRMLNSSPTGAPIELPRLDRLGFTSSSQNNQITLSDSARLEAALKTNPEAVKVFFTTASSGLANLVSTYSSRLADSTTGSLVDLQTRLQKRATALDAQLASMERQALAAQDRLTAGFVSMERVQAKLSQQLQYLQQRFQ